MSLKKGLKLLKNAHKDVVSLWQTQWLSLNRIIIVVYAM